MSNEIHLAFAHPSERARATGGDAPLDRISVRDHVLDVDIGAFQTERGRTQRLRFNVVVEVSPPDGELDDDVDKILSYDKITTAIAEELAAERLNLLETLAERIAERLLAEPRAERVFVRVEKLDRGPGALGVEIVRAKDAGKVEAPVESAPVTYSPDIVFLSNVAIGSPNLTAWLDALEAAEAPAILCVGAPDVPAAQSDAAMAQRRIDLLRIEENAWVLAGRDPRCLVIGTRTELDWAMKNNRLCVWAPSKMVLDAVEPPEAGADDAAGLTLWLADQLEAGQVRFVGATPPMNATRPVLVSSPDAETL